MNYSCFKCKKVITLAGTDRVGRRDSCPHCTTDLHACKNCKFYDPKSYNECRERSADRVVDKERSNYCDYFSFRAGDAESAATSTAVKKNPLDDLFK